MIHFIDQAIEQFLRAAVPLPEANVDVSFDAPDRTWGAAITRPTVNVFLWDIKYNGNLTQKGFTERRDDNGRVERQQPPAVVDLRYIITAWATDQRDEHELLGSVLRCVLRYPVLPADVLAGLPDEIGPLRMTLAQDSHDTPDFWSALDGRIKPGIEVALSVAFDVYAPATAGPPVHRAEVEVVRVPGAHGAEVADEQPIGTIRRTRQGTRLIAEGSVTPGSESTGPSDGESAPG